MIRKMEYLRNQELEYMNILDVGNEVEDLEGQNGLRSEDIVVGDEELNSNKRKTGSVKN